MHVSIIALSLQVSTIFSEYLDYEPLFTKKFFDFGGLSALPLNLPLT